MLIYLSSREIISVYLEFIWVKYCFYYLSIFVLNRALIYSLISNDLLSYLNNLYGFFDLSVFIDFKVGKTFSNLLLIKNLVIKSYKAFYYLH